MLQLSQRPLQATSVDAALFVDRASELERLSRSVRHGFNSLTLGERGSGKTSLLRRFERRLGEENVACRFVEASGAKAVEELVEVVDEALHGRRRESRESIYRSMAVLKGTAGIADDLRHLAPRDGGHVVVLLDSVSDPSLVQHLFGRLRDEVWQLPLTWVVAGDRAYRSRYLEPPADSFFDTILEIGDLDQQHAADLLRRRAVQADPNDVGAKVLLRYAEALAEQVKPLTPRNLLAAAREILIGSDDDHSKWMSHLAGQQMRAAELGRPHAMLFTELMGLGPVSASDERLLNRLGWTRARAAQVLKDLEQRGLVVVTDEAPSGPGRPRRLYAVASRDRAEGRPPED